MDPFISVIVVSYNYEKFLPRALNACANQTFKDYEIIIVDNGSTDNTQEVIAQFCREYPELRITVLKVDINIGPANGYNTGITAAAGTYIMFNDADDWMDVDCLESLSIKAKMTEADRVFGLYREIDKEGKLIRNVIFEKGMSYWLYLEFQGSIFRRSVFLEHNIFAPLYIGLQVDVYIGSKFLQYSKKNTWCNKIIYNYLINTHSTSGAKSGTNSLDQTIVQFGIFMPIYNDIKDKNIQEEIEYRLIKMYYFILFHYNRYNTYAETLNNYKSSKEIIQKYFPQYLLCKRLSLFRKNGDRKNGRRMTWFFSRLEKHHLMELFLKFYTFLSRFMYLHLR